jgi:hypothetical protein
VNLFGTRGWSLRRKLIVACVLVELGAMVTGVVRWLAAVATQALRGARPWRRRAQVVAVLDQALVDAAWRSAIIAAVQSMLDRVRDAADDAVSGGVRPLRLSGSSPALWLGCASRSAATRVDTGPVDLDRDGAIRPCTGP